MQDTVRIDALIHGGQGIGTLEDGKKVLLWNVLPGELVRFERKKGKKSYIEGIATEIIEASPDRTAPQDELYLSTSPWQVMSYTLENQQKAAILLESLQRGGVEGVSELTSFSAPDEQWHYRNKMEYSFWGDDDGLHLALFNRGTHRKQIVNGSSIARPEIDVVANAICQLLNERQIRAGSLKSLIVRCDQAGNCVVALFTRDEQFLEQSKLAADELLSICQGVMICFSNPKSPASVMTRELARYGDVTLHDELLGVSVGYDVLSFFQVNIPAYTSALQQIAEAVTGAEKIVDMYGGVGSIGLAVADDRSLQIVELDAFSVGMAQANIAALHTARDVPNKGTANASVVQASSEQALDYITSEIDVLIVDPPRAGLHDKVTQKIIDDGPQTVVYLSCNPSTLARDLEQLQSVYEIKQLHGHNFFPRTPHIEALAILRRRD